MERKVKVATADPVWTQFLDFLNIIWGFLITYQVWIFVIALLLVFGIWFTKYHRKQSAEIRKLWIFTLFFLTKRQMMIPLVITLGRRDKIIDEDTEKVLLEIRDRCRDVSLKKDPINRLALEREVSKVLFYYFSNLEENNRIKAGTKFEKIMKDLEFIDAKLVQLQAVYNRESEKWNKKVTWKVTSWFYAMFRFHPFEKFEMPK